MSQRKKPARRLNRGGAIIHAREILGPDACVFRAAEAVYIGNNEGPVASGKTWEEALEFARGSQPAKVYAEGRITLGNLFAAAFNSLRDKAREILKNPGKLTRSEHKYVKNCLRGLA